MPKNWCFWAVVLEKTLESPLDCKEIQPVHSKGDQSWVFIGRTDVEVETLILWPPDAESWLIRKDPDAGKDWGQDEKGMTEDEMVGWHHRHNGHGFGWTLRVGDGQGGLARCGSWGRKESDTTKQLNWTKLKASFAGYFISSPYMKAFPKIPIIFYPGLRSPPRVHQVMWLLPSISLMWRAAKYLSNISFSYYFHRSPMICWKHPRTCFQHLSFNTSETQFIILSSTPPSNYPGA